MQKSVKEERWKYIGGSDMPAIMGISSFESRFDLLLEKAQLKDNDFAGNEYTEYGNIMEPKIRKYVNNITGGDFVENKTISGDIRYHADGYSESLKSVLEIKTTSQIHADLNGYKKYLVQLLLGMEVNNVESGLLVVYRRPEDFDEDFDENRLQVFVVVKDQQKKLIAEMHKAIEAFRADLEYLKEHPFASEADLPSRLSLAPLAGRVYELEQSLIAYKDLEKQYEEAKADLLKAMTDHSIKTWTMNNGTKITAVAPGEPKKVQEFDAKAFEADHPELWKKYQVEKTQKGRKGYLTVKLPK